jgi:RNA polymerase II-associated protein 2
MTTDRFRETAIKHARIIEDQKRVKTQVADLILECFDLPTQPNASPKSASVQDIKTFKKALSLFQPSDFDELTSERNIDDRCGYALCPNPNQKYAGGGQKVWNRKGGKDFQLLDRGDVERWCSSECRKRGQFVRAQLSSEPAWVRDVTDTQVELLDDLQAANDLAAAVAKLSIDDARKEDLVRRLKELALERGDVDRPSVAAVEISERVPTENVPPPPQIAGDSVEGHAPRGVRFE